MNVGKLKYMLCVIAVSLTFAAGCRKESQEPATAAAPAEVRIGYFANLTHAQAVLGVHSGDFAKAVAPAKLTPRVFNAGPSLIEAMFAGEIDLGYVGPGPAIAGYTRSRGAALKVISGAAANGVVVVAAKGSGIASLSDLAGKRLATPQRANTQDIAARFYLTNTLKEKSLDKVLPVANAEQAALMDQGQLDAAWVPEPWGAMLEKLSGAKIIAEEKDLWPDKQFATTIVVASPKFLREHPETARKLLAAHQAWTLKLQSRDAAATAQLKEALFKLTNKELPAGVLDAALPRVLFTNDPLEKTLQTMAQWTYETGFAKEKPDLGSIVESSLVPAAPAK